MFSTWFYGQNGGRPASPEDDEHSLSAVNPEAVTVSADAPAPETDSATTSTSSPPPALAAHRVHSPSCFHAVKGRVGERAESLSAGSACSDQPEHPDDPRVALTVNAEIDDKSTYGDDKKLYPYGSFRFARQPVHPSACAQGERILRPGHTASPERSESLPPFALEDAGCEAGAEKDFIPVTEAANEPPFVPKKAEGAADWPDPADGVPHFGPEAQSFAWPLEAAAQGGSLVQSRLVRALHEACPFLEHMDWSNVMLFGETFLCLLAGSAPSVYDFCIYGKGVERVLSFAAAAEKHFRVEYFGTSCHGLVLRCFAKAGEDSHSYIFRARLRPHAGFSHALDEILIGTNAAGFDGRRFWFSEAGRRAYEQGRVMVNPVLLHETAAHRVAPLVEDLNRAIDYGFSVAVLGVDEEKLRALLWEKVRAEKKKPASVSLKHGVRRRDAQAARIVLSNCCDFEYSDPLCSQSRGKSLAGRCDYPSRASDLWAGRCPGRFVRREVVLKRKPCILEWQMCEAGMAIGYESYASFSRGYDRLEDFITKKPEDIWRMNLARLHAGHLDYVYAGGLSTVLSCEPFSAEAFKESFEQVKDFYQALLEGKTPEPDSNGAMRIDSHSMSRLHRLAEERDFEKIIEERRRALSRIEQLMGASDCTGLWKRDPSAVARDTLPDGFERAELLPREGPYRDAIFSIK